MSFEPFQLPQGMRIRGSFVDEANGRHGWLRRFEDEAERERRCRERLEPRVGELIDQDGIEVSILPATPPSFPR